MLYQIVSARKYYGSHATGRVVLANYYPIFHGSTKEANTFYKNVLARKQGKI